MPDAATLATAPQDGRVLSLLGIRITLLQTVAETRGAFTMLEIAVPPNLGPARHVHSREDEIVYVIAGEFEFERGMERYCLHPGESLHLPRGVPHAYRCVSEEDGRLISIGAPGGLENFLGELHELSRSGKTTTDDVFPIARKYGIRFLVSGRPV
jgi:quercetin dioxygenase-like cupin family protein